MSMPNVHYYGRANWKSRMRSVEGGKAEVQCRILAFSDVQAHTHQYGERPDRWRDFPAAIRTIRTVADTVAPDAIVFCGDLFEAKRQHSAFVWSHTVRAMRTLFGYCKSIAIAGNHDWYAGHCTLDAFEEDARIVRDKGEVIDINGVPIALVPYPVSGGLGAIVGADWRIAFSHVEPSNALLMGAPGIRTKRNSEIDALFRMGGKRTYAFNGHLHAPRRIRKRGCVPVVQIGSPLPVDWSDAPDPHQCKRGCVIVEVLTTGDVLHYRVGFHDFPRFYDNPPKNVRVRDGVDFVRRDAAVSTEIVSESETRIVSKTPEHAIAQYVKDKAKDSKLPAPSRRLIEAGVRYYMGDADRDVET